MEVQGFVGNHLAKWWLNCENRLPISPPLVLLSLLHPSFFILVFSPLSQPLLWRDIRGTGMRPTAICPRLLVSISSPRLPLFLFLESLLFTRSFLPWSRELIPKKAARRASILVSFAPFRISHFPPLLEPSSSPLYFPFSFFALTPFFPFPY